MSSTSSHQIKQRKESKDIFITPKALAKIHIDMIPDEYKTDESIWVDPCANNNSYYDQYPVNLKAKIRLEINDPEHPTDFFKHLICSSRIDAFCSNPPYSILDKWFKKTIEYNPKCFSYLIGIGNLTARRMEWCEKAGYGLTKMKMLKVKDWYGMSVIVVFEKGKKSIMDIDRTVWYAD